MGPHPQSNSTPSSLILQGLVFGYFAWFFELVQKAKKCHLEKKGSFFQMALFFDHFLRHSFLCPSLASLMPCLSYALLLLLLCLVFSLYYLRYNKNASNVRRCSCFAISPNAVLTCKGSQGVTRPLPLDPLTPQFNTIICMTKPVGESFALPSLAEPAHPSHSLLCV